MSFRLSGVMKHLVPPKALDGAIIDELTKTVKETVVSEGVENTVNEAITSNISKFNLMGKNLLPGIKIPENVPTGLENIKQVINLNGVYLKYNESPICIDNNMNIGEKFYIYTKQHPDDKYKSNLDYRAFEIGSYLSLVSDDGRKLILKVYDRYGNKGIYTTIEYSDFNKDDFNVIDADGKYYEPKMPLKIYNYNVDLNKDKVGVEVLNGWTNEIDVPVNYISGKILPHMRYGYAYKQKDILKDGSCKLYLPLDGKVYEANDDYEVVYNDDIPIGNGVFGPCIDFGTSGNTTNYVGVKNVPITQQATYTMRVFVRKYNSDMSALLSLADKDTDNRILFNLNAEGYVRIYISNSVDKILFDRPLELNKWHNIVLIINGTDIKVKVDNRVATIKMQEPLDITYSNNDNALVLGQEQDKVLGDYDEKQSLIGMMSDFRYFDKPLTDLELDKVAVEDYSITYTPHIACMFTDTPNMCQPFKTYIKNSLFKAIGDKMIVAFDFNTSKTGTYVLSIYSKDSDQTLNVEFTQNKNSSITRHKLIIDNTLFNYIPHNDDKNIEVSIISYDKDNLGTNGINNGRKLGTNKCTKIDAGTIFTISNLVMQPGDKEQPILNMENDNNIVESQYGLVNTKGEPSRVTDICVCQGPVSWNKGFKVNWKHLLNFDNKSMVAEVGGIRILEDGYYEFEAAQRANGDDKNPYIGIGLDGDRVKLELANGMLDINFWSHDHVNNNGGWSKSKFYGFLKKGMLITSGPASVYKDNLVYSDRGYVGYLKGRRVK